MLANVYYACQAQFSGARKIATKGISVAGNSFVSGAITLKGSVS
jgi:hypothetical protein